jgi:hypothetical protein
MTSLSSRVGGFAAALAVLAAACPALGEAPLRTTSLGWVRMPGAEGCIATRVLAQAVERRLGRSVFVSAAHADVSVEGRVERTAQPAGWRALITLSSDAGETLGTRELRSDKESCSALDEELALVIAVMIDPEAALSPPPPPPPRPPPAPPPLVREVVVKREVGPAPTPRTPAPKPWHTGFELGPTFALGLLPGIGVGATVRARLEPPWGPVIELGGAVYAPSDADVGDQGATFFLAEGFLGLCPLRSRVVGFQVEGCLSFAAGALRSGGFGFPLSSAKEQLVLNPTLEGRLRRRIVGPLTIGLGIALAAPIVRDRFFFRTPAGEEREVFRMSAVALTADTTVGIELP